MFGPPNPDKKKAGKNAPSTSGESKSHDTDSDDLQQDQELHQGVRKKIQTLTFGRRRKSLKDTNKKRKCSWAFKFPSRSRNVSQSGSGDSKSCSNSGCSSCECSISNKPQTVSSKVDETTVDRSSQSSPVKENSLPSYAVLDFVKFNPEEYQVEDWDEQARQQRAREIEEGVDPPPGFTPSQIDAQVVPEFPLTEKTLALCLQNHLLLVVPPAPYLERIEKISNEAARLSCDFMVKLRELYFQATKDNLNQPPTVHTQVDYVHCLVPDLLEITNCSSYWGKMDRYEAEKLLENRPEGTFLLRDSAQEEYLFSVSFQRYGRSLHARIEQWNHKFSFDSHDPGVFSSNTVCGLIEHYKDPTCCMYFEPMLTFPLHRTFPFSLQHLCRAAISSNIKYDDINSLQLPRSLKVYLKEYHYRQRVRVRRFDMDS